MGEGRIYHFNSSVMRVGGPKASSICIMISNYEMKSWKRHIYSN